MFDDTFCLHILQFMCSGRVSLKLMSLGGHLSNADLLADSPGGGLSGFPLSSLPAVDVDVPVAAISSWSSSSLFAAVFVCLWLFGLWLLGLRVSLMERFVEFLSCMVNCSFPSAFCP